MDVNQAAANFTPFIKGVFENPEQSGFSSFLPEEKGIAVNQAVDYYIKDNNITNEDDIKAVKQEADILLSKEKVTLGISRFKPTQEQAAELYPTVPVYQKGTRLDSYLTSIDKWKQDATQQSSGLRPSDSTDISFDINDRANAFIRQAASESNQTGWLWDKASRAIEGFAKPFADIIDKEESDRYFAERFAEDPNRDQDFMSQLSAGVGQLTSQVAIGATLTMAGAEAAIPAVFGALYTTQYMKSAYNEEFKRSGDSEKSLDAAISQIPAAGLDAFADTLLMGSGKITKNIGKEILSATTDEAKRQILKKAIPSLGKEIGKQTISEGLVGGVGVEFSSGYGAYLATGDESYLKSTKELITSGIIEGTLGAGFGAGISLINRNSDINATAKDLNEQIAYKQANQKDIFESLKKGDYDKALSLVQKSRQQFPYNVAPSTTSTTSTTAVNKNTNTQFKEEIKVLSNRLNEAKKAKNDTEVNRLSERIKAIRGGEILSDEISSGVMAIEPNQPGATESFVSLTLEDDSELDSDGSDVFYVNSDPWKLRSGAQAIGTDEINISPEGLVFVGKGRSLTAGKKDSQARFEVSPSPKKGWLPVQIVDEAVEGGVKRKVKILGGKVKSANVFDTTKPFTINGSNNGILEVTQNGKTQKYTGQRAQAIQNIQLQTKAVEAKKKLDDSDTQKLKSQDKAEQVLENRFKDWAQLEYLYQQANDPSKVWTDKEKESFNKQAERVAKSLQKFSDLQRQGDNKEDADAMDDILLHILNFGEQINNKKEGTKDQVFDTNPNNIEEQAEQQPGQVEQQTANISISPESTLESLVGQIINYNGQDSTVSVDNGQAVLTNSEGEFVVGNSNLTLQNLINNGENIQLPVKESIIPEEVVPGSPVKQQSQFVARPKQRAQKPLNPFFNKLRSKKQGKPVVNKQSPVIINNVEHSTVSDAPNNGINNEEVEAKLARLAFLKENKDINGNPKDPAKNAPLIEKIEKELNDIQGLLTKTGSPDTVTLIENATPEIQPEIQKIVYQPVDLVALEESLNSQLENLNKNIEDFKKETGAKDVYLVGGRYKGTPVKEGSDIDIIIVSDEKFASTFEGKLDENERMDEINKTAWKLFGRDVHVLQHFARQAPKEGRKIEVQKSPTEQFTTKLKEEIQTLKNKDQWEANLDKVISFFETGKPNDFVKGDIKIQFIKSVRKKVFGKSDVEKIDAVTRELSKKEKSKNKTKDISNDDLNQIIDDTIEDLTTDERSILEEEFGSFDFRANLKSAYAEFQAKSKEFSDNVNNVFNRIDVAIENNDVVSQYRYSVSQQDGGPMDINEANDFINQLPFPVKVENTNKVTDAGYQWNARTDFTKDNSGKIQKASITVNVANVENVEQLKNNINEELAHIIYNDSELRPLIQDIIDVSEVNEALTGYTQEQLTEESAVRLVADLVDKYDKKSSINKFITALKTFFKRVFGLEFKESELSYIAARAIQNAIGRINFEQSNIDNTIIPKKVIHYSRDALDLNPNESGERYNSGLDSVFGFGIYASTPELESGWGKMDRLVLGKNRNELNFNPKKPLLITPSNINSLIDSASNDNDVKKLIKEVFGRDIELDTPRFDYWIKNQLDNGTYDSVVISGFGLGENFTNSDDFKINIIEDMQDQIFVPPSQVNNVLSKGSESRFSLTQDYEVFDIDAIASGKISQQKRDAVKAIGKLRSTKIEQDLIVDEKEAYNLIKQVKVSFLKDSDAQEFVNLANDFITTRSRQKDPPQTRINSAREVISKASELIRKSNEGHYEFLQQEFGDLELKTDDGLYTFSELPFSYFNNQIDLAIDLIKSSMNLAENANININEEDFNVEYRITDLQELLREDTDAMQEIANRMADDVVFETSNEELKEFIPLMKELGGETIANRKQLVVDYINYLLSDVADLTSKQKRLRLYSLHSLIADGYPLYANNFITPQTQEILNQKLQGNVFPYVKVEQQAGLVEKSSSFATNIRRLGPELSNLMFKILSPFREGVNKAEIIHRRVVQPYLVKALEKAQRASGRNYNQADLNKLGIYGYLIQHRADETQSDGIKRNIRYLKESISHYSDSFDDTWKEAAQLHNNIIGELIEGIDTESSNPIDQIIDRAKTIFDDGMLQYHRDIVDLFQMTKPLAKFNTEFAYGRPFEEWTNYIPAFSVANDSSSQEQTGKELLTMSDKEMANGVLDKDKNMQRQGLSATKDRTRQLGKNRVLVFNINQLAESRMRLSLLDAFTATERRELTNLISEQGSSNSEFKNWLNDPHDNAGRANLIYRTVRQHWQHSIQSASFASKYDVLINNITRLVGSVKLSSGYQFFAQAISNTLPFFVTNINNPQKLARYFSALRTMVKYSSGTLDERSMKTVSRVLEGIKGRKLDASLDKSIKLNVSGEEMFQSFKSSPFYSVLEKGNKLRENILFSQFKYSDMLSGEPIILAEYLSNEIEAGRANEEWDGLTYNEQSYLKALDETERFIGIGGATRRGAFLHNGNWSITLLRNVLTSFASHRVNNATNFGVEWRRLTNNDISSEEKGKSIRYMAAIAAQSASFSAVKWGITIGIFNVIRGFLEEDKNSDELKSLYRKLVQGGISKQDKANLEAEISMREKIRTEFDNVKDRTNDKQLLMVNIMKDTIGNSLIIPSVFDFTLNYAVHVVYDQREADQFKKMKEEKLEYLNKKLKNAKALGNTSQQIELLQDLRRTESQEVVTAAFENRGFIPIDGAYGMAFEDMAKFGKTLAQQVNTTDAEPMNLYDLSLLAGTLGIGQADLSKLLRLRDKTQGAEFDYQKKIEELKKKK